MIVCALSPATKLLRARARIGGWLALMIALGEQKKRLFFHFSALTSHQEHANK